MGPYTKEEELRELSFQYITDAHQFAEQADVLLSDSGLVRKCEYHLGYLSKISVTLYMSIECSLKSCICTTHVGEDPHALYWKRIRPASHFVDRLKAEITGFSSIINDASLEAEINRLSTAEVSERYCLEVSAESDLLGDFNINSDELMNKIQECKELLATAKKLREVVWNYRKAAFTKQRTISPAAVKDVLKRIKTK